MPVDNTNTQGAVADNTPAGAQAGTGAAASGQGAASGEGAGQGETKTYAGYSTPEELAAAYESQKKTVEELSSLKGRLGNELGSLRTEKARLEGMVQAIQAQRAANASPQVTLSDLDLKFEKGEITIPEYIRQRDILREREIEQRVEQKVGGFKSELEMQRYRERFISENSGYVEAYSKGDLAPWLDRGMSGEEAWTQFKLKQANDQLEALKKQNEELTNKARQEGIQAGTKIEQGKQAAGKVLGEGGGASFGAAGKNPQVLKTHSERVAAGVAYLNRMRGGT